MIPAVSKGQKNSIFLKFFFSVSMNIEKLDFFRKFFVVKKPSFFYSQSLFVSSGDKQESSDGDEGVPAPAPHESSAEVR